MTAAIVRQALVAQTREDDERRRLEHDTSQTMLQVNTTRGDATDGTNIHKYETTTGVL